jgi:hypothetical protein
MPTLMREHSAQRSQEGAIGGRNDGRGLLPTEHDQLMAQNEQLDVLGELAAQLRSRAFGPRPRTR